jgi:hypothetical protein
VKWKLNGSTPRWISSLLKGDSDPDRYLYSYRRIALQLRYDLSAVDSRSVLLVTANASPLSSIAASILSQCLAEDTHQRILLVDACTRTPELTRHLGAQGRPGLVDLLSNRALPLAQLLLPTTQEHVLFLSAGTTSSNGRLPDRDQVQALLDASSASCDYVVIAGGPVSDPLVLTLSSKVGCVLLLVIDNQTTVDDLHAAESALALCKPRKAGLVFTMPVGGDRWTL